MGHKNVLSAQFNMSLGFIPVIFSILLCEFITQDTAIYIGTGIGLLYSYISAYRKRARIPNFILYISTSMLILLSLATLIPGEYVPPKTLPLTLEVSVLIPMLSLYLHRKRFINHFLKQKEACHKRLFAQGAESSLVAAHIVSGLGILHFILISFFLLFMHPLSPTITQILYHIFPPSVFIASIIFNQIGINYFNKLMEHTEYVPIVNTKGDVIGKSLALEAMNYKNDYINPVVRIAISSHGMLFLCHRPQTVFVDKEKTDLPLGCYLRYGETLVEGCRRILKNAFPNAPELKPAFSIVHRFENKVTNQLVYLFLLDLEDDSILCNRNFKGGKLWRFQQMEQNLHKNYFSECFEQEFEHLKTIIGIREKYREF